MKALFLSIGVIFAIMSIGALTDTESRGMGVFFLVVAIVLIAAGLKKQKKPSASSPAPSLPLNGTIIPRINNPLPPSTTPATPVSAPAPVRYAPNYAPTKNGMILYKHYRNVGIYTPENMLPNLSVVSRFDTVRFVPEPQNTYDPGAVRVMCGRVAIGYLYKNNFQEMVRRFLERSDCDVLGHIAGIEDGKVTIDEVFYRISEPLFECAISSQDELCEVGDVLPVSYEYEKEAYIVGESGKIPKKYHEELDESNDYIAIVTEIDEHLKVAVYETAE